MTVLPCTRESSLMGCLKSKTDPDQVELYWRLADRREERDKMASDNKNMLVRNGDMIRLRLIRL